MTKSTGFIDFSNMGGEDTWDYGDTGGHTRQGKLFVPQGKRCHETHPDLAIGGGILIGGNCRDHKRHTGVDYYIALDAGHQHPLFELGGTIPHCIYYPIQNMQVPKRPDKFDGLIDTIIAVLSQNKRVHVGCIGGHGRTGLVIAAVVARLGVCKDNDAINWTRENYCKKAIETKKQENFLTVNFGCKMQPAGKTPYQSYKKGYRG